MPSQTRRHTVGVRMSSNGWDYSKALLILVYETAQLQHYLMYVHHFTFKSNIDFCYYGKAGMHTDIQVRGHACKKVDRHAGWRTGKHTTFQTNK